MQTTLNAIETDFIQFFAQYSGQKKTDVKKKYQHIKNHIQFASREYRNLTDTIHILHSLQYDDRDEREIIKAYQYHEFIHLYRFLSYSFGNATSFPRPGLGQIIRNLKNEGTSAMYWSLVGRFSPKVQQDPFTITRGLSHQLASQLKPKAVIVDYGCGLGYLSFEIAKKVPHTTVYLVDIDTIILRFAQFRFKKYNLNVQTIPVTIQNLYPKLPKHNLCIATEVMEHVFKPLEVYNHIHLAMGKDGLLYGNFEDHKDEMFHVSPVLNQLRSKIASEYHWIATNLYRKK